MARRSRLLVAVDSSPAATAAARVAGKIAVGLDADVSILHVHDLGVTDRGAKAPEIEALRAVSGLGARAHVTARAGEPVDEILAAARSLRPDVLVMGTRGRSSLAGLLLGSVSQEVIARAACPVLLVRADAAVDAPYKIVLAVEGLSGLRPLVNITRKLASALEAFVYAVHVRYPGSGDIERALYHTPETHGEQAAATAVAWLSRAGVRAEAIPLEARSGVARAIADYADVAGADLIVMGAHVSAGAPDGARIGPAVSVAHAAEQPVLVAREDSEPR